MGNPNCEEATCKHPLRQLKNGAWVCDRCNCVSLVVTGEQKTRSLYEHCIRDTDALLQENKEKWRIAEHEHNTNTAPEKLLDAYYKFMMAKKIIKTRMTLNGNFRDDDYKRTLDKELYTLFQSAEIIETHCQK